MATVIEASETTMHLRLCASMHLYVPLCDWLLHLTPF